MRTCNGVSRSCRKKDFQIFQTTYGDVVISQTLGENTNNGLLMLLLDNARGRSKNSEGCFPHTCLGRLAGLEQYTQQFGPLLT